MNRLSASFIAGLVCLSAVAQEAVSPNGKISMALKDNGYVINYLDKAVLFCVAVRARLVPSIFIS